MGLVAQVFDEGKLQALSGARARSATRATRPPARRTGRTRSRSCAHRPGRTVALGHNGNLTNTAELRAELAGARRAARARRPTPRSSARSSRAPRHARRGGGRDAMGRIRGAFSAVVLSEDTLLAFRDPDGIRPLVLGDLDGASRAWPRRRCALDIVGATDVRELKPGELVILDAQGRRVIAGRAAAPRREALCVFEHIYFARPDAQMDGQTLHAARERMGERLAAEAPVDADVVIPVPDSGTPAAQGYARACGPAVRRRPDQEPLRRPHVHPARPGAARARRAAEVQPAAARHRGQAASSSSTTRSCAARRRARSCRCCARRARARCTCGSRRRRSSRPATTASTWPATDELIAADRSLDEIREHARRRLARVPLARGPAARDRAPGRPLLPRLPDGRLPGAGARGGSAAASSASRREPARA